jgi:hypothetical protein
MQCKKFPVAGTDQKLAPNKYVTNIGPKICYIRRGFRPEKLRGAACGSLKYAIPERKMADFEP